MIDKNGKKNEQKRQIGGKRDPVTGVYIPTDEEVEYKREWSIFKKL